MNDNCSLKCHQQNDDSSVHKYFYTEVHPVSWEAARALSYKLVSWVFRGHADAKWSLSTTVGRSANRQKCLPHFIAQRESWMLHQFKRRAHHYIANSPPDDALLEWLALIQHHGGPTRLLDFTHSFYIAAFFAVEQANSDAAVWAVNLRYIHRKVAEKTKSGLKANTPRDVRNTYHTRLCNSVIGKNVGLRLVADCEPDRMNERLAAQQGVFLFPTDLSAPFVQNLVDMFDLSLDALSSRRPITYDRGTHIQMEVMLGTVMKIMLPRERHRTVLNDLASMNITAATLFPGIDGFARSLHRHLNVFQPDEEFFENVTA